MIESTKRTTKTRRVISTPKYTPSRKTVTPINNNNTTPINNNNTRVIRNNSTRPSYNNTRPSNNTRPTINRTNTSRPSTPIRTTRSRSGNGGRNN
mgnify:FL=1